MSTFTDDELTKMASVTTLPSFHMDLHDHDGQENRATFVGRWEEVEAAYLGGRHSRALAREVLELQAENDRFRSGRLHPNVEAWVVVFERSGWLDPWPETLAGAARRLCNERDDQQSRADRLRRALALERCDPSATPDDWRAGEDHYQHERASVIRIGPGKWRAEVDGYRVGGKPCSGGFDGVHETALAAIEACEAEMGGGSDE